MAEMLPRHYLIGIVIFTFFMIGGMSILSQYIAVDPDYGDADKIEQFNRTFNVLDNVNTEIGNLQDNVESASTDFGTFGVLNSLISSAWNSLKLLLSSFSFMNSVFYGLNTFFGIPAWIPGLIILLITILIVFAIWSAIFQRDI